MELTAGPAAALLFGAFFLLIVLRVPVAFALGLACLPILAIEPRLSPMTLFNETFKTPAGQIAAAPALTFASDPATYTGSVGGGIWMVSSHSKNLKAGADFVQWVTTNADFLKTSGTYPAYKSAAESWLNEQASKDYFADDVAPVFKAAAGQVWPDWAATTQYSQEGIYASTILPALTAGETLTSKLPDWQTAIEQKARSLGYQVN